MLFEPDKALSEQLICFTTSIYGGVSKNNYFSFNLGAHVGDNSALVTKNRGLLHDKLAKKHCAYGAKSSKEALRPIKWLNQAHTNLVCDYNHVGDKPSDGIFTDEFNVPLAVMTADCMPVVLFSRNLQQLAVVHAGWRGLLQGIIQSGLDKFSDVSDLQVWIGPSISQSHFEVSDDVIHQFDNFQAHVKPSGLQGKWKVCLPSIAKDILQGRSVNSVQIASQCTYQNKDFFSHRRAGHAGFSHTGRMATVAMMVK